MSGPYALGERAVRWHTRRRSPGVYKLLMTPDGPVRYVGRSDTNIRSRLLQHVSDGEYGFFWVVHETDSVDAFLRECRLWHRHKHTIDNDQVHPARPRGCGDTCPRCGYYS